jgi:hypothetical protein
MPAMAMAMETMTVMEMATVTARIAMPALMLMVAH